MDQRAEWLLVDMGNSRIKYCRAQGETLGQIRVATSGELLKQVQPGCPIWVSSVGHSEALAELEAYALTVGARLHKVSTQSKTLGLHCGYAEPGLLGVDRWLAMLAVHHRNHQPYAVVDMGTAITLDIVAESRHQGGWIAPGVDTMRSSLLRGTEGVSADNDYPDAMALGRTTSDAVNLGVLAMARGVVLQAQERLSEYGNHGRVYLTGGGARQLNKLFGSNVQWVDNLVLRGLHRLAARP